MSHSTHVYVAGWNKHQTSNPMMFGAVGSIPTISYFFLKKTLDVNFVQKFQICVANENLG